jgi:aryl-alcohol dehydrogenase-like predicted oxidoreductase
VAAACASPTSCASRSTAASTTSTRRPDYSDTLSEQSIGQAIKGRRDKVFVASKFCTPDGHLDKNTPVEQIIEAVEASLKRLDYRLRRPAPRPRLQRSRPPHGADVPRGVRPAEAAGQGAVHGVSSHTPELETVMNHAVDSGRFDVIMVAYNFKNWPDLTNIMAKAHDKGVGFVAMKTLKGAHHTALKEFTPDERNSFTQAAFKWVNSNDKVCGLVVTMTKPSHIDEYLFASGKKARAEDLVLLDKYDS